jgi:ATPase family associated with various cellular activities (AAA)
MLDTISSPPMIAENHSLLAVLRSLDRLLDRAITQAKLADDPDAVPASYRGLYLHPSEMERALQRQPGESPLQATTLELDEFAQDFGQAIGQSQPLIQLQQLFHLSWVDLALVVIALAPEIDLRYERIYAFLQDDVTRKRPTVELALNLFCDSFINKLKCRAQLTAESPLIRYGILHLTGEAITSFLAYAIKLDEQISRFLLGIPGLDERLHPCCYLLPGRNTPANLPVTANTQDRLDRLIPGLLSTAVPVHLYLQGASGIGKARVAESIAARWGKSVLNVDLTLLLEQPDALPTLLNLMHREACCQNALLYLHGWEAILKREYSSTRQLYLTFVAKFPATLILAGQQPLPAEIAGQLPVVTLALTLPEAAERRVYWQASLTQAGIDLESETVQTLGNHFRLTPEQIDQAIAMATHQSRWVTPKNQIEPELFFRAARQQSSQALTQLAQKVSVKSTWADIVLPPETRTQLQEVCTWAKYQATVLEQWGFDRKLSRGKGITALFSGPPGTGKTMAAEVLAHDLQLDLYKIDLSQIISKYIGETEKNLDRIFSAAHNANAILFFDEADALFGKRSEVKDAHDRHANIEVAYLLQKMEEYEGVAVLATNLRQNMDDAFVRRIQAIIEFPFPDEESRQHLWQVSFPTAAPLHQDVDFGFLAREIKLPGGNIKNISLAACFYAASQGRAISQADLIKAAAREHQKLGRRWQFEPDDGA